jgi:sugar phosphate isomerase/epimerase
MTLPLAAASYGFVYYRTLEQSLGDIAELGYELVEIATPAQHIDLSTLTAGERRAIKRALDGAGLKCVATNPVEMNPISPILDHWQTARRHYRAALELAAELEAPYVVMVSGRANPLAPMPEEQTKALLRGRIEELVPLAERLGVKIALETVPYGFLQSSAEVAAMVKEFDTPGLGMCLDCANVYWPGGDPAADIRELSASVDIVHISDAARDNWAHTQIGRGEIDFGAIAEALRDTGFTGPTVYELVDGEDPGPRLRSDWAQLAEWGWGKCATALHGADA